MNEDQREREEREFRWIRFTAFMVLAMLIVSGVQATTSWFRARSVEERLQELEQGRKDQRIRNAKQDDFNDLIQRYIKDHM